MTSRRGETGAGPRSSGSIWPQYREAPLLDGTGRPMYIHRMVRTLFHLDEAIHARLRTYGTAGPKGRPASLRAISGLRKDRRDIGVTDESVRRRRREEHRGRRLGR